MWTILVVSIKNKMYIDQLDIILIYVQCDLKEIVIIWYGIIWQFLFLIKNKN